MDRGRPRLRRPEALHGRRRRRCVGPLGCGGDSFRHHDRAIFLADKFRAGIGDQDRGMCPREPTADCMPKLSRTLFGRLTIALAVAFAMFAAPPGPSSSHDPVFASHAALYDHGHSHDDEPLPDTAGHGDHEHKHNPFDHSHDKPGTLPRFDAPVPPGAAQHALARQDRGVGGEPSALDRPPRPSDTA